MPTEGSKEGLIVGIDLGTTHSLIAVCDGRRPRVLRNALHEVLTPSVVGMIDGDVLVGSAARDRAMLEPDSAVASFKRDMGTDATYEMAGRSWSPIELSSCVLRSLCQDAEAALGRPVTEAVISVPAYFDDSQRRATREAARLANLHVERLINEPTAAAIAYGLDHLDKEQRAVVLDLGGGTFDVTVLELIEGVIEIQSTAGDCRLGGEDFTATLAQAALDELDSSGHRLAKEDRQGRHRLTAACEAAKRALSRQESVPVQVTGLKLANGKGFTLDTSFDRSQAEELWQPLLTKMRLPIRRALRDAGVSAAEIDQVLLVGGASRMPCFIDLATEFFEQEPRLDLPLDEVVVQGAALQAGLKEGDAALEDLIVTDVASHSLGIEVVDQYAYQPITDVFSPVLERGTVLPSSRVKTYSTGHPQQTGLTLQVFQGEHPVCSKNRKLGELQIDGLPVTGELQPVEVRFTYDLNGVLEVQATIVSSGECHTLLLEQSSGRWGSAEIERAQAAMQALKFHPRDALPNTAALSKAEALYTELRGEERERLGDCIANFRASLESYDESRIESAREMLRALIRGLEVRD